MSCLKAEKRGRSGQRVDDDDRLQRIRSELEQLVAVRLRRPLNVMERDRWKQLTALERELLEPHRTAERPVHEEHDLKLLRPT